MNALDDLLENLINGNLATAKRQARRHSADRLRRHFTDNGMSGEAAALAALYLKCPSQATFQAYCDAK